MLYKANNYVKRRKIRGYHIHTFEVSSLDDVVQRVLEIQALPGTPTDERVEELISQKPYFTAEDEDFKNDKIKVMVGRLWEYGFASEPKLSHPFRMPKLSNKAEIHTIEINKGIYNGKRFKKEENESIEQEIIKKYKFQDCSEQVEYNDFLKRRGASLLKEGRNYRIIEVPEGQFKITFSF